MIEKVIYLEGIDPVNIFGVNNQSFDAIKEAFPKLRITARGNEIKALGDKPNIETFEEKINSIIEYYQKYQSLDKNEVDEILEPKGAVILKDQVEDRDVLLYGNNGKAIKPRSENQNKLVSSFDNNDLIFAIGPAGTGKTYTAIALAVRSLRTKEVQRIILTRPAVEAGEKLGFLPGDVKEKLDPYLQPLYDALNDMIPVRKLNTFIEEGTIQIAPLAYMRGRTLDNAFVILDEAQNATHSQIKMFLTRMGKNARFIVNGDLTQIDLPDKKQSGLGKAVQLLSNIEGIAVIEFDHRDIVRHKLVKEIVKAYNQE